MSDKHLVEAMAEETMAEAIHIPDPEGCGREGADVCMAEDGPDCIVHDAGPDCARLHGLRVAELRCSICDQIWGDSAYSAHEGCRRIAAGGDRAYAHPVIYLTDGRIAVMEQR